MPRFHGIFGRFVPRAIVNAMIAGRGVLAPVEREATVLFADIAGFTAMTERAGAARTSRSCQRLFRRGDADHRRAQRHRHAVPWRRRARDVQRPGRGPATRNQRLRSGPRDPRLCRGARFRRRTHPGAHRHQHGFLVAGNVGGGGRQSYTVYGERSISRPGSRRCARNMTLRSCFRQPRRRRCPKRNSSRSANRRRGFAEPVSVFSLCMPRSDMQMSRPITREF